MPYRHYVPNALSSHTMTHYAHYALIALIAALPFMLASDMQRLPIATLRPTTILALVVLALVGAGWLVGIGLRMAST